MLIGLWIGVATVAGFIYWYLYFEDGPQISYAQLTNVKVFHWKLKPSMLMWLILQIFAATFR